MQTEINTTQTISPPQSTTNDRTDQLQKQLFTQLREVSSDPGMFNDFIKFISRFHNYSLYNRILIFIQRRNASQVAGYRTWQSIGRQVNKGETGITIYAPKWRKIKQEDGTVEEICLAGFRTVSVFDYEQTSPINPEDIDVHIPSCGKLEVDNPEVVYEKLKYIAYNFGLQVIETNMEFAKAGSTNGKVIKINRLTASDAKCSTMLHEIAHVQLQHTEDRKMIPRHVKEVEAELTAFLIGLSIGLPKGNYEYVQSWLSEEVMTDEVLEQVIKTSDRLISMIKSIKMPTIN